MTTEVLESQAETRLLEIRQRLAAGFGHWLLAGKLLKDARTNRDWEFYHLENFSQYAEQLNISYAHAMRLVQCYETFVDKFGLSPERLAEIGMSRLFLLYSPRQDG